MPSFNVVGLGTMFTVFGGKATPALNVKPMQMLAWLVKENRPPAEQRTGTLQHPAHPSGMREQLRSTDEAHEYVARIYARIWPGVLSRLGAKKDTRIIFVPVPASNVTHETTDQARWPGRKMALRLEQLGLGQCSPALRHIAAHEEQAKSKIRTSPSERFERMSCAPLDLVGDARVILVDDISTHGATLAAAHAHLGETTVLGGICTAFTHMTNDPPDDCFDVEVRQIFYDRQAGPHWGVDVARVHRGPTL